MIEKLKSLCRNIFRNFGFDIIRVYDPVGYFHSDSYLRHNARRLEHLVSLRIPVSGKSVLEVGAGIGDHSHFYIDRGCNITITEARLSNLLYLKRRYPNCDVQFLNMEHPSQINGSPFDIVHCYGLLYHLNNPAQALEYLSKNTKSLLFLETCVSLGENGGRNLVHESQNNPTQSVSGNGCRPTRSWIYWQLKGLFKYVYLPVTQPNHEEFPLDWTTATNNQARLTRAIFIACHDELKNDLLIPALIDKQYQH
jgi:cyclopropane fatty-acyl-phospholipid synthase-like methyltransferase